MTARVLTIKERDRQSVGMLASLGTSLCRAGRGQPEGSRRQLGHQPLLPRRREQAGGLRAAAARGRPPEGPFVYQAQYDQAERLIAVPYETFTQLARDLPDVRRLILIYATGRSGSTLLKSYV
jgi:hypothetical protein